MIDGRKACAKLCETSRLALYLARLGQRAGLHHAPLFVKPAWRGAPVRPGAVRAEGGGYGLQTGDGDRKEKGAGRRAGPAGFLRQGESADP